MEPNTNNNSKVFIVTGTSTGLGFSIVKKILDKKFRVVAFTRSKETLENKIKEYYSKSNINGIDFKSNLLAIQVDITNQESVEDGIQKTLKVFGRIDVVINNAGFNQWGNAEEVSDKNHREIFEVNYFSVMNVLRSTLPILRKQRNGLILNVSSLIGYLPFPGFSTYVASKFALTGLTLSIAKEVEHLGINVVCLLPGTYKTEIGENKQFKALQTPIEDYYPNGSLQQTYDLYDKYGDFAKGSSDKFADAVLEINQHHDQGKKLPASLFLGSDSVQGAEHYFTNLLDQIKEWKDLCNSTDH
ncbi:hypothetical protein ACTFIU_003771 [Dictyostelium citrinum]